MAIRAVLFDVDGTLYRQSVLRALMAAELGLVPWTRHSPAQVQRLWRMLRTFRHVREELRQVVDGPEPLERLQYTAAAERAGVSPDEMRAAVDEWLFRRPLRHLRRAARTDTVRALETLRAAGLPIGVFSDYPTYAKVEALGLERLISLHVCATDTEVNAFKPHPRGFLLACERWGLRPAEVLYVGDRVQTDAVGAGAAGLPCRIIGSRTSAGTRSLRRLFDVCAIAANPASQA